jgi:hypothetical protein
MILLDFVAANTYLCIFSVVIYAFEYAPMFLAQLF